MADSALGNKKNILVGAASLYLGNNAGDAKTDKPDFVDESVPDAGDGESYRDTLAGAAHDPAESDLTLPAAWRSTGYTQEGLEVSYEPSYGDVEVDQLLDSALVFKQSMRVSLNTTLAEATLYNLMVAWGQSGDTLTSSGAESDLDVEGGALGEAPVERSFIAVGNAPRDSDASNVYNERVYHAFRVLNVEASTHSLRRSENTGIPVSLRALPGSSGLYGSIKDRARQW